MLGSASKALSAHRCNCDLSQSLSILEIHRFRDLIQNLLRSLSSFLVACIDHCRMDSLVQQELCSLQKFTGENYGCSSAISHFIVLSLGHFYEHFAAGCCTSNSSKTVAPSLVIVTSP